jgi:hypothetical protein
MPKVIVIKLGMYIMPPESITTAYLINLSRWYYGHYSPSNSMSDTEFEAK